MQPDCYKQPERKDIPLREVFFSTLTEFQDHSAGVGTMRSGHPKTSRIDQNVNRMCEVRPKYVHICSS